ncbi:MAG: 3-hydroxyacyl-CoA dehydrogenase NAD-binding domain-containing protein, partial [Alphaproteobacteria bacterium]
MSELVQFSKRGAVGVITVTNPPVNALSVGVPDGIIAGVEASEADPGISAMVLIGDGRTFIAGADIKEFNKPRSPDSKSLLDVITRFEAATKPVIVAIHGTALGGGLECAMGGHYRCAVASAKVGQPEVKIGIIPGAGGTQRLPRLVGVEKGLDMCVGGNPISAGAAHKLGLIDEIIDGDLLAGAVAYAERLIAEGAPLKRVRDDHSKVAGDHEALFDGYRKAIARKARGYMAPWHCIDAVKAATELDFDAGIARERELFNECLASPQAKGLMYSFFAERAANKVSGISKETPVLNIARGGVIGAGTMGGGIAMNFANAGIPVRITDSTQEFLDKGLARIRSNYERSVKSGRFDMAEVDRRMGLIEPTLALADFSDVDYVIEAVFEEMEIKRDMFRRLDAACKPDAILASNTSYLNIDEIAGETGRPGKVLGTHFFSPANVMRLLEIVRGAATDSTTLATTIQLSKAMGKVG